MINLIKRLFSSDGFVPHGHGYPWNSSMVWVQILSDGLIALAYLTIPATLIYIARKRKDIPFDWIFACFGIFILACGTTQALEIWTLWTPTYWLLGTVKAITAVASVTTAILLVKLIPRLLILPGSVRLREVNAALEKEIGERRRTVERLVQSATLLRIAGDAARLGGWSLRLPCHTLIWSDETCAIHEVSPGYLPTLEEAIAYYAPEDRAKVNRWVGACTQDGVPFDFELQITTAKGRRLWVRVIGEAVRGAQGEITAIQGAIQDISSRRQGEDAVREKDALARIAGRVTRTGGWVMDMPWQSVSWSEELYDILEYPRDHVPQLAEGLALYPEPGRGEISAGMEACIREGTPFDLELEILTRRGNRIWVRACGEAERHADGSVRRVLGAFQDITERKEAEMATRFSEQRYRSLVEATTAIVWDTPASGKFEVAQPGWSAFTGQSFEELRGWGWLNAIHPDDQAETARVWSAAVETQSMYQVEHRLRAADLSYRDMMVRAAPILAEDGKIRQWIGVHTDITEQRQAERELKQVKIDAAVREAQERYAFLADAVPQIVWTAQPDGRLDYFNKAWFIYAGLTLDQTKDWGWGTVLHPDHLQPCLDRWAQSLATGDPYEFEFSLQRASDRTYRWHLVRALPMRNEHGSIVQWVGACTDIDDAKRSEETLQAANDVLGLRVLERTAELSAAKDAAEAANQAKSEFLANMSHEIRTPLNGVLGMTDLVLETALDPEQREYLGMAKTSGQILLALINDILDFSKMEAGKLELEAVGFGVRHSLENLLKPLVLRAKRKGLELRVEIAEDVPEHLIGDPLRLRQILLNLVDNALKFTAHGAITVKVAAEPAGAGEQVLRFSVADTGVGIPAEKQGAIFEAFAQVDGSTTRNYGGTGLGLAIASQLIARMGGAITIESNVGEGTAFHFTAGFRLGTDRASAPMVAFEAEAVEIGAAVGLRILLAEDNLINCALATGIIKKRGHSLVHARNGREAVEIAGAGTFDLILMDVQMPEMGGFEATACIRETERATGRHTPIIAMTAHAMTGDRERCLAAGMDDYLSKPLEKGELLGLLARVSGERNAALTN